MNNLEEEISFTFRQVVESLHKPATWSSCTLLMEFYTRELGVGYSAFSTDVSGSQTNIDADVNYDFNFLFKIIEWQANSKARNLWNMASFTLTKSGEFNQKTWWNQKLEEDIYG